MDWTARDIFLVAIEAQPPFAHQLPVVESPFRKAWARMKELSDNPEQKAT